MDNLLIRAAREKWRFESVKGSLEFERLWDLPLTSKTGADLDTVGKAIRSELRSTEEESLVSPSTNSAARSVLEGKLELVKMVIKAKQDQNAAIAAKAAARSERQKLLAKLEQRKDAELDSLSAEQIEERLAAANRILMG